MRVAVRVRPGASRTRVGGSYGDDARLVVAVSARAVDGKATKATLDAVADALGIRPRAVTLVSGATARDKVLEIDATAADLTDAEISRRLKSLVEQ
jgi:uncharacterized protein YggU (UPF0235/DUF167 family)